jgi:hypothetical protein
MYSIMCLLYSFVGRQSTPNNNKKTKINNYSKRVDSTSRERSLIFLIPPPSFCTHIYKVDLLLSSLAARVCVCGRYFIR